jgi:hypothetical protein
VPAGVADGWADLPSLSPCSTHSCQHIMLMRHFRPLLSPWLHPFLRVCNIFSGELFYSFTCRHGWFYFNLNFLTRRNKPLLKPPLVPVCLLFGAQLPVDQDLFIHEVSTRRSYTTTHHSR